VRRAIPLIVVLVLALAAAAWFSVDRDPTGLDAAVAVERRLKSGDVAGARAEMAATRGRVPAWRTDYLESIVLFAEERSAEAVAPAERAYAAAPDDWRVVSMVFHARVRGDRPDDGWAALDRYLGDHPADERALACAVQYWTGMAPGREDPERAAGYLDRIEKLPRRTAPPGDPTELSDARLESLRSVVAALRGRLRDAVAAAREAVQRAPQDARARARLADFLRQSGDLVGAAAALREAVRLNPAELLYQETLALVLLDVDGGGEEALEVARRLAAARPADSGFGILEARALARVRREEDAIDVYRALLGTDLSPERRKEVLRNLAVALYDYRQGGQPGPYLDEAHTLLAEYRRLGGEIDERLADVWFTLEERARKMNAERPR